MHEKKHVKKSVQSYLGTATKQLQVHILFLDHAKHDMSVYIHSLTIQMTKRVILLSSSG